MSDLDPVDILLVEDDVNDAELTVRALRKRNLANRLSVVEDGAAALDFLFRSGRWEKRDARPPRVVLLDLKLPRMNGLEVLRAMRADERTRRIPVVIVTSSREDPDIQSAYDLGANGYVVKPVDFEAFAEVMTSVGLYWVLVNEPPR